MSSLVVLALLLPQAPSFPSATPESQGIESAWLAELGAVVQGYVDAEKIVGAELLVIRNDHVVLHDGFGWRHREESVPMEPGGVFCWRSMTKAVVGAAVQMLIDEHELRASDPVAKYLPSFDNERSRDITVEHLLTHTSGLPLSSLLGQDLTQLAGERAVADLTGAKGPEHPPGQGFHYSDDNADALGAIVEVVSGQELSVFLEQRLFGPLGMRETAGVMSLEHPLRPLLCSAYAGGPGGWTRFFGPTDAPLFPFLLASQGLYGTALDYARFLHLWKEKGRVGGERLLSPRAVRHALEPGNAMSMPSAFDGLEARYGQMMQLWVERGAEGGQADGNRVETRIETLVAFGHGGSDGTMAWVFPELDLMVLYFTQSRNGLTVIEIGAHVQRLLLDPLLGTKRAPPLEYTAPELEDYLGLYWEEDDRELQAVLLRGGGLAVEFPGRSVVELAATPARDAFRFRLSADYRMEFERSPEGAVVAFTRFTRGQTERLPRLVPSSALPSAEEILDHARAATGEDALRALGGLRVRATLELPQGQSGRIEAQVAGLARWRSVVDFGGEPEHSLLRDGRAWSWRTGAPLEELQGERRAQLELEHPLLPVADWRALYREVRVLAAVEYEGVDALLVRAEPSAGIPHTWYVAAESGLPLALYAVSTVPGLGEIGSVTEYDGWRDVGGARLPFTRRIRFASSLIGTITERWESVETGRAFPPETFEPPSPEPSGAR